MAFPMICDGTFIVQDKDSNMSKERVLRGKKANRTVSQYMPTQRTCSVANTANVKVILLC